MNRDRDRRAAVVAPARRGEAGFSLSELAISLGILVIVILGVLAMFDLNNRIARTQTHLSEMQQSQRVAQQSILRLARMAGRGGLPIFDAVAGIRIPQGVALGIDNNVAAGTQLGGTASAQVLPGTDVLTVRGVFTTPIYVSDPENTVDFVEPPSGGGAGSLTLFNVTDSGARQDLRDIAEAVSDAGGGDRDALLLANALGDYAVVEITGGASVPPSPGPNDEITQVTINFTNSGGTYTEDFNDLSDGGSYPSPFQRVAFAGVLEEYRFYVRDRRANPADDSANPLPQLVRARFVPNTDTAYRGDVANLTEVLADNILDLQLAFGIDWDADELVEEGAAGTGYTPNADEWLFNDPADNAADAEWNQDLGEFYYLRVTTLARTDRPTPKYLAETITAIEDNDWSAAPFNRYNQRVERAYQRRQIRTIVDLRNL